MGVPHAAVGQPRLLEKVIHDRADLLRRHVPRIGTEVEVAALGLEVAELAEELTPALVPALLPSSRVSGRGWR